MCTRYQFGMSHIHGQDHDMSLLSRLLGGVEQKEGNLGAEELKAILHNTAELQQQQKTKSIAKKLQ